MLSLCVKPAGGADFTPLSCHADSAGVRPAMERFGDWSSHAHRAVD